MPDNDNKENGKIVNIKNMPGSSDSGNIKGGNTAVSFKKNDELLLNIEDFGTNGEGIGKIQGYTMFVKDALPGDKVRVKVMKTKKSYAYAKLMDIIEPSKWRTEPACPAARQCGGCQLQHCQYEKQLEYKKKKTEDCLKRIGGFKDIKAEPVIGMEVPYYYRNKAQFPAGCNKEGKIITGFYAQRTHNIIPFKDCLIQQPFNGIILDAITSYMEENNISVYNETTHKGIVRHIIIRTGQATGEIMVCLVINADKLPKADRLTEKLLNCGFSMYKKDNRTMAEECITNNNTEINNITLDGIYDKIPFIKSICININKERTNVILGQKTDVIYGTPYITDYIGDVMYHISPVSFYQVNHKQTARLYEKVMEFADLKGSETVWDLYCGIGTISLFLARKAAKVYGVEIVGQAVEDAKENAILNNMDNVEFFHGAAEEVVPLQYEKSGGRLKADVVTLDPPRKGCGEKLLITVADMKPARIVYVSCDPATLARDLKYLCSKGYKLEKVQPVDMFGQSSHVETVALLGKQNGKPLPDENIKELAAYLGSGNAKPDDTIEIRVDADKVYEILDREKEAKESK